MAAAGTWGILRNALQEFPSIQWAGTDADRSIRTANTPALEPDAFGVAARGSAWWSPRLLAAPSQPSVSELQPTRRMPGRSLLITGGLGGLGILFAHWAAQQGFQQLHLLDCGGSLPTALLRSLPLVAITIIRSDLACTEEASAATRAANAGAPVDHVLHAAGVLEDKSLLRQTPGSFRAVLAGKVSGLLRMGSALTALPTRGLALFSSVSSIVAPVGQPNYAAANAMLNNWASGHVTRGIAVTSVQWGAWAGAGMAATHNLLPRIVKSGLGLVSPTQGIAALAAALGSSAAAWRPQLVASPFEWPKLMAGATHIFPLFSDHAPAATTAGTVAAAADAPYARRRKARRSACREPQQPMAEAAAAAENALRRVAAVVSGVLGKEVDAKQPLMEAGLDSLGAVELRNALGAEFDAELPATVTFDYPSVSDLASFLAGKRSLLNIPGLLSADCLSGSYHAFAGPASG